MVGHQDAGSARDFVVRVILVVLLNLEDTYT